MARAALRSATFFFGFALCLEVGRSGLMPIDHSIVFDGGWRLASGQVPFRDFGTPVGLVPSAIQALFFALLGVDWFAYCLHAALANGGFALLVAALVERHGGGCRLALGYGALSSLLFYPPIGVPYLEQHAILFALAALVAVGAAGARPEGSLGRALLAAAVPLGLLLAWWSKPNPTILLVPIVVGAAVAARWRAPDWGVAAAASAIALATTLAAALAIDVDFDWLRELGWTLPARLGASRAAFQWRVAGGLPSLVGLLREWRLWSAWVVLGSAPLLLATALREPRGRRARAAWTAPLLPVLLVVASLVFTRLTFRSVWTGCALLLPAMGIVHAALLPRAGRWPRLAAGLASLLLAVPAARDAWVFHHGVNLSGIANLAGRAAARRLDPDEVAILPELRFLRWSLPGSERFTAADLAALVAELRSDRRSFFLLGDLQILYALAGKPSTSPVLWWHPDLTFPTDGAGVATAGFQCRLLEWLDRLDVRRIVRQGEATQLGVAPASFPRVARVVSRRAIATRAFGGFQVIDLAPHAFRTAARRCATGAGRRREAPGGKGTSRPVERLVRPPVVPLPVSSLDAGAHGAIRSARRNR